MGSSDVAWPWAPRYPPIRALLRSPSLSTKVSARRPAVCRAVVLQGQSSPGIRLPEPAWHAAQMSPCSVACSWWVVTLWRRWRSPKGNLVLDAPGHHSPRSGVELAVWAVSTTSDQLLLAQARWNSETNLSASSSMPSQSCQPLSPPGTLRSAHTDSLARILRLPSATRFYCI